MLTQETKKKIDSARDILVGKVPDPKAQVEQITTALIYKFMDDMDKKSMSLPKGKNQFFTNGFEKYAWHKLMNPRLGGHDRLELYVEAITKMSQNPHLPQLFRDIFKDTFLPYRNPETLTMFLKEINGFTYDHSEDLGDAFEYLLSVLGSQGDAGQFRTPRHIIDFIVAAVDPSKDDTVCDPACGTAGFLISAYKHILRQHDGKDDPDRKEKPLTPDQRKKLMSHLIGYDISPDMVRLSKVNLYLHGFPNPTIYEYDTLSSEEKWDDSFDVMLANPPFMTPKGGIKPHKRFSVQANRSEVLFVDYILEHLRPNGRAGIIVPEGIIFQVGKAYNALRKALIEDGLLAVVSLPAGIFNPYSGVKTSILFFDNALAKITKDLLFIRIHNDGYDLGAQRREIGDNDLPIALDIIGNLKSSLKEGGRLSLTDSSQSLAHLVSKEQILNTPSCILSGDRYKVTTAGKIQKWPMIELGEILEYEQPTKYIVNSVNYDDKYPIPVLTAGKTFILGYTNETEGIFRENLPVIIFDDFTTATKFVDFPFKVKSSAMKILRADVNKANIKFVYYAMQSIVFPVNEHKRYWISEYSKKKIPLPPIEVQNDIVKQIELKQRAIDAARQVIAALEREREYFGQALRKLDCEWVMLDQVCDINPDSVDPVKIFGKSTFTYIDISSVENGTGRISFDNVINASSAPSRARRVVQSGDVIISTVRPNLRAFALLEKVPDRVLASTGFAVLRSKKSILPRFLHAICSSDIVVDQMIARMGKGSYPSINETDVAQIKIPLPPISIQEELIRELLQENDTIEANGWIIEYYKEKIAKVLSEI